MMFGIDTMTKLLLHSAVSSTLSGANIWCSCVFSAPLIVPVVHKLCNVVEPGMVLSHP